MINRCIIHQQAAYVNACKARAYMKEGCIETARIFQQHAANEYAFARACMRIEDKHDTYAAMYGGRRWQQ